MSRTFSPAQLAYLLASATYDAARDEANAHMDAYEAMCDANEAAMSADEYDAWRAARRNDPPNPILVAQVAAMGALRLAEQALIEWTIGRVAHLARTPEQKAALETMRTVKPWQVKAYDGAIDLAMRLDA